MEQQIINKIKKLHCLAVNKGAFAGESHNAAAMAVRLIEKHGLKRLFSKEYNELQDILTPIALSGLWGTTTADTGKVAEVIYMAGANGITMKGIKGVTGLKNTYHCLCDKFAAKGYITITKNGRIKLFTVTTAGENAAKRYFDTMRKAA